MRERERERLYHQDGVAIVAVDIANMLRCKLGWHFSDLEAPIHTRPQRQDLEGGKEAADVNEQRRCLLCPTALYMEDWGEGIAEFPSDLQCCRRLWWNWERFVEEAVAGGCHTHTHTRDGRGERRREDNNLSGGRGEEKRCLVGCLWEDSAAECKRWERSSNRLHQPMGIVGVIS